MLRRKTLIGSLIVAAVGTLAIGSTAQAGQWAANHPRRVEVNNRLANQNNRIHRDVQDGQMSRGEARNLHRDDRQIRQEERDMASQDYSHLTRADQRALNQQENQVSRRIAQ
ncbi:hypothetical protein EVC45_22350 [Paraburkholderia sp. UYCP14C]|uniref:hypothetical protein n=1 Tax=Paraburkholderia sp. UYCP14C TaxID=2511130 RepID=UPI0010213B03|nr:hypothetical protein [Paraburkholderia sp. UYCP14C]RZF27583.1 hypothetical protein EVC45_22350 [Paraburkholderia sp. UYCP14C]